MARRAPNIFDAAGRATRYHLDTTDANRYVQVVKRLRKAFPNAVGMFFTGVGRDLTTAIRIDYETLPLAGNTQPMRYTGAYGKALTFSPPPKGHSINTGVAIGFDTTIDPRLPIYWRTMETGSEPVRVPIEPLAQWASGKGIGDPRAVRNAIALRGVRPQRLLARYFTEDGRQLTERSKDIVSKNLDRFIAEWRKHFTPLSGHQMTMMRRFPHLGTPL